MGTKPAMTVIVGPTASGKTDYAIALAKKQNGAVVSADSRQVYVGMDVGTATPRRSANGGGYGGQEPHDILTTDIVEGIPHYLLDIREPNNPLTLADWQEAAYKAIEKILQDGQHPIIAGGTMLYIDSLLFNYDIPKVGPNLELRDKLEQLPVDDLYTTLLGKDPDAQQFIEPKNKRRIIRALEVMEATGEKFSQQRREQETLYTFTVLGLFPQPTHKASTSAKATVDKPAGDGQWEPLRERITKRAQQMLKDGLLEETQALREKYGADLPLLQTMNYKEAGQVLDGVSTKEKALDQMVSANVRYARRQMSWWRGRSEIQWIACAERGSTN